MPIQKHPLSFAPLPFFYISKIKNSSLMRNTENIEMMMLIIKIHTCIAILLDCGNHFCFSLLNWHAGDCYGKCPY